MKKRIFAAYVVSLHLALFLILIYPDSVGRAYYKLGIIDAPLARHDYYMEATWYYYAERSKTLDPRSDDLIFLGNSITNRLCAESLFKAVNFGISDEKVKGAHKKIKMLNNLTNKRIFLAYGINDIPGNTNTIFNDYKTLIGNIPESATIYISSILPVNEELYKDHFGKAKPNSQINDLNRLLKEFAQLNERIHYLNTAKYLFDPSGQLASDCQAGDGIHLNDRGYSLWVKGIEKEMQKLDDLVN